MGTTRTCSSCGDVFTGTLDHCPKDGTALFTDEVMSRVGLLLKDHEIQGVIGEGGMGVVYRAQHVVIEKPVAIKVLYDRYAKQKDMVEQFIVEAKAASRIRHPNIIDVTDFGTTPEGLVFLVMEYLDGESLETRLERVKRLPVFEAVNIIRQVGRGLAAAHELGIVHRDLKPANIFLCSREGRRRIVRRTADANGTTFSIEPEQKYDFVKLLDFGVAKFLDLGPSAATRNGVICGTPHYLSPEQAREQSATELSDIYSLGAVFYEMVTGFVPFDGKSMLEILNGHVAGVLVKPSERAPDAGISPALDAVIGKCLEKDPARRFATALEMVEALAGCVTDRAFLRDAYRLPGIERSGLDLSEAIPAARAVKDTGFSAVEQRAIAEAINEINHENDTTPDSVGDGIDVDALDEHPRSSRVRKDTVRIQRSSRKPLVLVLVLLVAGAAAWAFRDRILPSSPVAPTATAPAAPAPAKPASAPTPTPAPEAAKTPEAKPAGLEPKHKPEMALTAPSAKAEEHLLGPAPPRGAEKATPPRIRLPPGVGLAQIPAESLPSPTPTPPSPSPTAQAPEPTPSAPAAAPAAEATSTDIETLLREAQQAWLKQYYAVAVDKAEAALKIDPNRQAAYQIIAVCSCALRQAEAAKQAVSRLDEPKHRMVQKLCQRHGIDLE